MKTERTWKIAEMHGISVIVTTLVDGSTFVYPVSEVNTLSEWVAVVKSVEHDRLVALMDSKSVYEHPDQKTTA